MSAPILFKIRMIRAAHVGGRRLAAGAEIELDAATAVELVRAGAALLVDPADIDILRQMAPRPINGAAVRR